MVVVDASAILEVLLQGPGAGTVSARLLAPGETMCAPHLLDVEVAQALRRYNLAGEIDDDRGEEALEDFADMVIARYTHELCLPRVWELRHNVTAYDAVYLALAEHLGAPLVTRDSRLARAPGHQAVVEVV